MTADDNLALPSFPTADSGGRCPPANIARELGSGTETLVRAQLLDGHLSPYARTGKTGETGVPGSIRAAGPAHAGPPKRRVVTAHVGALRLGQLADELRSTGRAAIATDPSRPGESIVAVAAVPYTTHVLPVELIGEIAPLLGEVAVEDYSSLTDEVTARLGRRPAFADLGVAARLCTAGLVDTSRDLSLSELLTAATGMALLLPVLQRGCVLDMAGRAQQLRAFHVIVQQRIAELGLAPTWHLERAVTPVLYGVGERGVGVDRPGWQRLVVERERRARALAQTVEQTLGISRPDDAEHVRARLLHVGVAVTATDGDSLADSIQHPGVRELVQLRKLTAFLRDAGPKVLEASAADGRVHAQWIQIGTVTGRITCRNPALTNIENEPAVRGLFVPAPGCIFVRGDYPQAELRVAAALLGERALRDGFTNGVDPHTSTAARIGGKRLDDVTTVERRAAKSLNFGMFYDIQPSGLAKRVRAEYGITLSQEKAAAHIEAFRLTHPSFAAYQDAVRNSPPPWTRSRGGRLRFHQIDDTVGSRLATPIQSTVADILKYALVLADHYLAPLSARIVLVVHDEIVAEAPAARKDAARVALQRAMNEAFAYYVPELPSGVEPEICTSWAGGAP